MLCTAKPTWLSLSTTFFDKVLFVEGLRNIVFLKGSCHQIPIPLYDILELNVQQMSVRVEPNVSVFQITEYLIPKGFTLAVTLEIGDATLGGLAFGVGMTTHSHKVNFRFI